MSHRRIRAGSVGGCSHPTGRSRTASSGRVRAHEDRAVRVVDVERDPAGARVGTDEHRRIVAERSAAAVAVGRLPVMGRQRFIEREFSPAAGDRVSARVCERSLKGGELPVGAVPCLLPLSLLDNRGGAVPELIDLVVLPGSVVGGPKIAGRHNRVGTTRGRCRGGGPHRSGTRVQAHSTRKLLRAAKAGQPPLSSAFGVRATASILCGARAAHKQLGPDARRDVAAQTPPVDRHCTRASAYRVPTIRTPMRSDLPPLVGAVDVRHPLGGGGASQRRQQPSTPARRSLGERDSWGSRSPTAGLERWR